MKKFFTLFSIYYLLSTVLYANSAKAIISDTKIIIGDIVQLKIKARGNIVVFPKIKKIDGVKVLEQYERTTNVHTYNNGVLKQERTLLVLTFAPQKDVTVPVYEVEIDGKIYKTKPIDIKVMKLNDPYVTFNNKLSLLLHTEKRSVIVGEPLIVTVRFSSHKKIRLSQKLAYTQPDFDGFFVTELGKKTSTQGEYQVSELSYLLTPKEEGNYSIGPATAKVGMADTSKKDMFGNFFGTVWKTIASNALMIEVKTNPKSTDLVGNYTLKSTMDKEQVKANRPVNLTVKIEGEGNLEDFEFPAYEIDGVTIYSDEAKVETQVINNQLKSTYVKTFVFISDHDFNIPEQRISVYNIKKGEVVTLDIPAYKIKVEGTKAVTPTQTVPDEGIVQTNIKQVKESQESNNSANVEEQKIAWWVLISAFILGMLVMYLSQFLKRFKRKPNPFKEEEALKILYGHMSEDKEVEAMVRKLYARKNGDTSVQIDKKELKEMVERFNE